MKILLLDNYDSFTYNLVQLVEQVSSFPIDVIKNDHLKIESVCDYDKIILSPGPGLPHEYSSMLEVIKRFSSTKSILGVCLGHQAISVAFGGTLLNLKDVFHGLATPTDVLEQDYLFHGIPSRFLAGRYHSWVVDEKSIPSFLRVTARDESGTIMALTHKEYDVCGVQFHPESILTEYGEEMMRNWIFKRG